MGIVRVIPVRARVLAAVSMMLVVSVADAHAQATRWYAAADVGVGRVGGETGVNLSAGGARVWSRLLTAARVDAILVHPTEDRYYREPFSNGESRCRDAATGQLAADGDCRPLDVHLGIIADVNFLIPTARPLFVGVGYRGGPGASTVVGTAGVFFSALGDRDEGYVRLAAGAGFFEASFGFLLASLPSPPRPD